MMAMFSTTSRFAYDGANAKATGADVPAAPSESKSHPALMQLTLTMTQKLIDRKRQRK
jgi:hypothetical protein